MQALYSDQHRDLDNGYGVKYETGPTQPHLALAFVPWRGGRAHRELMAALPFASGIGGLVRDRDGGEVRVGRDGQPVVRYHLSDYDLGHLRAGLDGAAQIHEAAGAKRIFSSHNRWVAFRARPRRRPGAVHGRLRRRGYGGQCMLGSFHIMGSARMGGSPASSACDPTARPGTCATSWSATARPSRRPRA